MNCALIVAAGLGTRMGNKGGKQFLSLMGKPVLAHTLIAFQSAPTIDAIVVVTVKDSLDRCRIIAGEFGITKLVQVVEGGKERMDSVFNGLKAVRSIKGMQNVVIHDGARPLVEPRSIDEVVVNLKDCDGVITGVPAVDTIKLVSDGMVVETLDRTMTWQIQTPQAFNIETLIRAHEASQTIGFVGTDDSVLIERIGGNVKVILGSRENLKITTPEDLVIAESILNK